MESWTGFPGTGIGVGRALLALGGTLWEAGTGYCDLGHRPILGLFKSIWTLSQKHELSSYYERWAWPHFKQQKWRACLAFENTHTEKWHPAALSWKDSPPPRRLVWFLFTHKATSYFLRQNLRTFQAHTLTHTTQDFCSDPWHPSPPFHIH